MLRREFLKWSVLSSTVLSPTLIYSNLSSNSKLKTDRVIYYWNLQSPPEGLNGAIKIIEDLNADFIWYAHWMVGFPMPESPNQASEIAKSAGLSTSDSKKFADWCKYNYYSLSCVKTQVEALDSKIYCPAILGYTNFRIDFNFDPISFKPIDAKSMLLNFGKWGIKSAKSGNTYTLKETQQMFWNRGLPKHNGIPDFSKKEVVEYYIKRAKAFKNSGAKAVWYDTFFQLPLKLAKIFGYNDMVKDLYNGCCSIVEGARELGLEVGTWIQCLEFPYRKPKVDFVTASPSTEEVLNIKPDINKWTKYYEICSENNTNLILIFDFADRDNLPLPVFSQKLTPQEQSELFREALQGEGNY